MLTTERMAEIAKLAIRLQQIRSCAAVTSSGETVLHHTHVDEILSALHDVTAELLAVREAQPVGWLYDGDKALPPTFVLGDNDPSEYWKVKYERVYTAPPVPAVPAVPGIDELRLTFERSDRESDDGFNLHKYGIGYADEATQARWESWLACRAAMLKGAK